MWSPRPPRRVRGGRIIAPIDAWGRRVLPPPPVYPFYGLGARSVLAAVGNDIDQLVASTAGSMTWPFLASVRYNVTAPGNAVASWGDGRAITPSAIAFAQATGAKQPPISGSGPTRVITPDGVSKWLKTPSVAAFDLSQACIGMMAVLNLTDPGNTGAYHLPFMVAPTAGNIPALTICRDSGYANRQIGDVYAEFGDSGASPSHVLPDGSTTVGTNTASMRTLNGKRMAVFAWRTPSAYFFQVPPLPVVSIASGAAAVAGNCALGFGVDGSGTLFDAASASAVGIFTAGAGGPAPADVSRCAAWAIANEYALNDGPVMVVWVGNSITFGTSVIPRSLNFATVAITQAQLASWADVNTGVPSRTAAQALADVNTYLAQFANTARLKTIWVIRIGTNDLASNQNTGLGTYAVVKQIGAAIRAFPGVNRLVGANMLPRTLATMTGGQTLAGFRSGRSDYNGAMNADAFWDGVIADGQDPFYGVDGSEDDTAKYTAGVHPTPLTDSHIAPNTTPVLLAA